MQKTKEGFFVFSKEEVKNIEKHVDSAKKCLKSLHADCWFDGTDEEVGILKSLSAPDGIMKISGWAERTKS